jgi:RNA polymerase sigma-70 factor (ECF subfamily)
VLPSRLKRENQLALTLKILCGFGIAEIARALLVTEETIKKRVQRARRDLIRFGVSLAPPSTAELGARLDAVHEVLYLLFNEGYSASTGDAPIRAELCEDAVWLCHLLCSDERFASPSSIALMALMLFHAARLNARIDDLGGALLLHEQDRGKWDNAMIARAEAYLARSAEGPVMSAYHLEAAIACHHCTAPSYAETDWPAIRRLYDVLIAKYPSPVYVLNRAVVIAEIEGPKEGLRALEHPAAGPSLANYFLYDATVAEFHRRDGSTGKARAHLESAMRKARAEHDRAQLRRLLQRLDVFSGTDFRR